MLISLNFYSIVKKLLIYNITYKNIAADKTAYA